MLSDLFLILLLGQAVPVPPTEPPAPSENQEQCEKDTKLDKLELSLDELNAELQRKIEEMRARQSLEL